MTIHLLGIDIGATNTRIAVLNTNGEIITSEHLPSQMALGRPFFEELAARAAALSQTYQARVVGVGSAGQIDRMSGSYLPGLYPKAAWVGVPLREIVQYATGLPTYVDNDCKMSAYAELKIGQGQGFQDFVALTVGTGLGGGIIGNGQLLQGAQGIAGHVGHISITSHGPQCLCGNRGCLELYASGTAVAKRGSEVLQEKLSSPQVFQLAAVGNQKALQVVHEMADALGQGLGVMTNMLNPERFILSGSILEWYPLLEETMHQSFTASAMNGLQNTPILCSNLAGQGGIIGAALYAWDQSQI